MHPERLLGAHRAIVRNSTLAWARQGLRGRGLDGLDFLRIMSVIDIAISDIAVIETSPAAFE
jgi:hypothetical protein